MKMKMKKGSSSILIIMIVISLVVLGVFSITSSYYGKKLSNINYTSTKNYYSLYGDSNRIIYTVYYRFLNEGEYLKLEDLKQEIESEFANISELNMTKNNDELNLSFILNPPNNYGTSRVIEVVYSTKEADYKVIKSKSEPMTIEINDVEEFQNFE